MNTPQTDSTAASPAGPLTALRRLEDAGAGEPAGRGEGDGWRGFAFGIGELSLVVPCADGAEIVPCRALRALPLSREWVAGMITLHGEIHAVIDFARFIGRRPAVSDAGTHGGADLLLLSNGKLKSALLADGRISVRRFAHDLPQAGISAFPPALAPFLRTALTDGAHPWGVLDSAALLGSRRFLNIGR